MRQVVADRVKELMSERRIGLLDAQRMALSENADWAAQHALDELEILLGEDAARHIDALVQARIAAYPGR